MKKDEVRVVPAENNQQKKNNNTLLWHKFVG